MNLALQLYAVMLLLLVDGFLNSEVIHEQMMSVVLHQVNLIELVNVATRHKEARKCRAADRHSVACDGPCFCVGSCSAENAKHA